jgi:hypothetical protein
VETKKTGPHGSDNPRTESQIRSADSKEGTMFEKQPDPQLEVLKTQLAEMISLQRSLLTKLQEQNVMLGSIAKFVRENSAGTAAFGVIR